MASGHRENKDFKQTNHGSLAIGCVYRPPNSPYNTALQTLEHCIRTTKHNTDYTLITGDLNAKNNAWLSTDNTDPAGEELRDLLVLYGLQQLVDFPTYLYRGTPYSCIDIVATDCSTISVTSAAPVGGSDHLSINVHINSPPHPHPIGSVKRAARWRWLPHNVLSLRQSLAGADLIGDPPLDTPDSNEVTELYGQTGGTQSYNSQQCTAPHQTPFQQEPWPIPALDNKGAAKLDQGET